LRSHRGRMTKAEVLAREEKPAAEKQPEKEARQTSLEEQARAQRRIAALERKIGQQQVELDFFSASLAASQGSAPAVRRAWRDGIYEVIQAMTASRSQGEIGIERMCQLAGISGPHRLQRGHHPGLRPVWRASVTPRSQRRRSYHRL